MKRPDKTDHISRTLILLIGLALLVTGCAAPQASSGLLQQRIDELIQIQQQQAQQLEKLQQQLTSLKSEPPEAPLVTEEPLVVTTQQIQEVEPAPQLLPIAPSAAEVAEISQAAGLYLEAFAAIATGQMPQAETGFKTFLERFPDHEYAGNANYWMAEALLSQQKAKHAETIWLNIIDNPKQQNKAPAAMARLILFYRANNARDNAMAMTQMLTDRYPESPELKRLMRSKEPR